MKRSALLLGVVVSMIPVLSSSFPEEAGVRTNVKSEQLLAVQMAVLAHTLVEAKDLPDIGMLPKDGPIIVQSDIPGQKATIDSRALPSIKGRKLVLMTRKEIQDKADRDDATLTYVEIDSIVVEGTVAKVSVGTNMAIPTNSHLAKLCCCTGLAIFNLVKDSWIFGNWSETVCARLHNMPLNPTVANSAPAG